MDHGRRCCPLPSRLLWLISTFSCFSQSLMVQFLFFFFWKKKNTTTTCNMREDRGLTGLVTWYSNNLYGLACHKSCLNSILSYSWTSSAPQSAWPLMEMTRANHFWLNQIPDCWTDMPSLGKVEKGREEHGCALRGNSICAGDITNCGNIWLKELCVSIY